MASRNSSRPAVKHLSHSHPLRLSKAKQDDELICSGCELDLIGPAYKCTKSDCDYFLHKSCFLLPQEINHKSHTDHPLTLLFSTPYNPSMFTCNACGESGTGFLYNCTTCQYDLHIGCVSMPENVEREGHEHLLALFYSSPYTEKGSGFKCDVCEEIVPENVWVYFCRDCDYGTHLHPCAEDEEEEEEEERRPARNSGKKKRADPGEDAVSSAKDTMEKMLQAQQEMSRLQLETQMAMQHAKILSRARKAAIKYI